MVLSRLSCTDKVNVSLSPCLASPMSQWGAGRAQVSLGQEDPLKKEMTTHLVFFSGESDGQTENPMEPGELQSIV